jgi:hypothetical protein
MVGFDKNDIETSGYTKTSSPVISYLQTPRNRVLLEKLTVLQLVKKFSEIYETRRFITAFTSAHHLSLS